MRIEFVRFQLYYICTLGIARCQSDELLAFCGCCANGHVHVHR